MPIRSMRRGARTADPPPPPRPPADRVGSRPAAAAPHHVAEVAKTCRCGLRGSGWAGGWHPAPSRGAADRARTTAAPAPGRACPRSSRSPPTEQTEARRGGGAAASGAAGGGGAGRPRAAAPRWTIPEPRCVAARSLRAPGRRALRAPGARGEDPCRQGGGPGGRSVGAGHQGNWWTLTLNEDGPLWARQATGGSGIWHGEGRDGCFGPRRCRDATASARSDHQRRHPGLRCRGCRRAPSGPLLRRGGRCRGTLCIDPAQLGINRFRLLSLRQRGPGNSV